MVSAMTDAQRNPGHNRENILGFRAIAIFSQRESQRPDGFKRPDKQVANFFTPNRWRAHRSPGNSL